MQAAGVTLIGLDDRAGWERASAAGLPSHSWHYAAGLAQAGLRPMLAVVQAEGAVGGARMILPFHLRSWEGPDRAAHVDIATLPGLSGLVVLPHETADQAETEPLFAAWRAYAVAQGWVSGYLQLSPRNASLVAPPGDAIAAHNSLFEFELDHWQFETDVRRKVRWTLRLGAREGARFVTPGMGAEAALQAGVLELYPQAMARLGGEIFPPETLHAWFADPELCLFGAELGGRIVAVEVARRRGDQAELHLAGSAPEGRSLHGWLIWQMAEWFRDQGVAVFNIGGYGRAGDGLHDMKRRLGTLERPMRSLRQIYRPDVYAALCAAAGQDPGQLYFPAYRRAPLAALPEGGG